MRTIGYRKVKTFQGELEIPRTFDSLEQEIGQLLWSIGVAEKVFNVFTDADKMTFDDIVEDWSEFGVTVGHLTFERQEKGWVSYLWVEIPQTFHEPADVDCQGFVVEAGLTPAEVVKKTWEKLFAHQWDECFGTYAEANWDDDIPEMF